MGVRACALALWCALAVAVAAAYTIDCNHEYTDCDTELSKLGEDEELTSSSGISEIIEAFSAPTPFLPTVLPEIQQEKTTTTKVEKTTEATTTSEPVKDVETAETEQKDNVKEPRLLNLSVDELQNFANALHNQTFKQKGPKIDLSDVNMDDEEEEPRLIPHDHSKHDKHIPDKFYTNLQVPFNPLMAMDRASEELDTCKENDEVYKIGDHIERGCDETCECQPGGTFDCTPRCKHPYIRRGRKLSDPLCFESPVDECCSIIACATGNQDVKANKLEVCRYNNKTYTVGEHWEVGCKETCTCTTNSVVSCKPRCKKLQPSDKCINVQDPEDECCEIQVCDVSQDVHEEPENVTSSTGAPTVSTSTSTTTKLPSLAGMTDFDEMRRNSANNQQVAPVTPKIPENPIGSIKVLQNNSVQVNLIHMNTSDNPVHLLLSNDGGKSFREIELDYSNLILNLDGGKDYILKAKDNDANFNFTITRSDIEHVDQGCNQDGQFYRIGEEFHIGCTELCECTGPNNERECVELNCPSHVGLELVSKGCVRWAPSPPPTPPNCCPRTARCLSDGTCHYKGHAVPNWSEVPIALTGCEQRCFCENGELDCQEVCTPLPPLPPQTLRCPPQHHPAPVNISDDDCCKHWGCLPNAEKKAITHTQTQKGMKTFPSKSIEVVTLSTTTTTADPILLPDDLFGNYKTLTKGEFYRTKIHPGKTIGKYMKVILPVTVKPTQNSPEKFVLYSSEEIDTIEKNNTDHNKEMKAYFTKLKDSNKANFSRKSLDWRPVVTPGLLDVWRTNKKSFPKLPYEEIDLSKEKPDTPVPIAALKNQPRLFLPEYVHLNLEPSMKMFIPYTSNNRSESYYDDAKMAYKNLVPHEKILFKGSRKNYNPRKGSYSKQLKYSPLLLENYPNQLKKTQLLQTTNPYEVLVMTPKKMTKFANHVQSPLDLYQFTNQMDIDSSGEVNRNLGRSASAEHDHVQEKVKERKAGKVIPSPDIVAATPNNPQAPFLPTIPPDVFPTEDYDQNSLHRPVNPRDPLIQNIPGFTIPPNNYGEENKKLTVLSIQADSPTSVKLLFGLPPVLVGLRGSVDLRYTDMADEDISHWYSQVFAPADEVLTTPRLEFRLTGLKPSTTYKIKGKLFLHNLPVEPESQVYSVRTLDIPSVLPIEEKRKEIDSKLSLVDVNDTAAHVSWRHFTEDELRFIDGIQVRFRPVGTPIYSMTELLHHSRSIAVLHDLRPGTKYEASLVLVPPPRATTELHDPGRVEFTTAPFVDPYNWSVIIEAHVVGSNAAELTWYGVPSPAERWVRVYRAAHACGASRQEHDAFRLATRDLPPTIMLSGLEANTRCRVWMELFLTNGKIKTSNVLEINTKSEQAPEDIDNKIEASSVAGARGRGDYYGALVVVGVVAALGALTSLLLLLVLVRRHRPRSVPITPVPSAPRESSLPPYDNPAYKIELQQETMDL